MEEASQGAAFAVSRSGRPVDAAPMLRSWLHDCLPCAMLIGNSFGVVPHIGGDDPMKMCIFFDWELVFPAYAGLEAS